jgi:hypothetical protein
MGKDKTAKIISTKVICKQTERYIGWPTIARRASGELVVCFSGDRDAHVCPYGKNQMVTSRNNGKTWTKPVTINNTPLDDRDGGIIETNKGTLLVSWFTSLAFEVLEQFQWRKIPAAMTAGWLRHGQKIGPEVRKQWLGSWVRRSTDGGKTWGDPISVSGSTPHGPIRLRNGRLLYLGKDIIAWLRGEPAAITIEESRDDGKTWKVISTVPISQQRMKRLRFCEPHLVETESGKLIAMFRVATHDASQAFMYQSVSTDGGRNWTRPRKTDIYGYPPHLIRLKNGWLLVVYGQRRRP